MKVINVTLPSSHEIVLAGDQHLGISLSSTESVETLYDYVQKDKNRFIVKTGDRIEAITVDDKRFMVDSTNKVPIPLLQIQEALRQDARVANRTIVELIGNHELKLWKFGNLTEYLATELSKIAKKQVHYGTYTCVINVHDKHGLCYRIWASHGFGSFQSQAKDYEQREGNMRAQLKNRLRYKAGDCLIMAMGHTHRLIITPPTKQLYLTYGSGKPKQHYLEWDGSNDGYTDPDCRFYVNTGSFLKMYGEGVISYAEMKGYDPVELGAAIIKVEDRKVTNVRKMIL